LIKTNAINHVCLWVRSIPEAKAYYEKLFGFTCTPRAGDSQTLVVESEQVHFFICEAMTDSEFLSKQHISFEVPALEPVIEQLKASGIADVKIGAVDFFTHQNYKWCEWRDPSGIRLECVELIS
jgi:catechol 2,3-dioxygenase-like lactoylglutathione lyase family enzyme